MLDEAELIHMGGRVYDPLLGRFLSADPNVPEPGNSQSFNRYAYVYNNPLSYTDPSGFVATARMIHGAAYVAPIAPVMGGGFTSVGCSGAYASGLCSGPKPNKRVMDSEVKRAMKPEAEEADVSVVGGGPGKPLTDDEIKALRDAQIEIEEMRQGEGETEGEFYERVRSVIYEHRENTGYEACTVICTDPQGTLSADVVSQESRVGCVSESCPAETKSTGRGMHAHGKNGERQPILSLM